MNFFLPLVRKIMVLLAISSASIMDFPQKEAPSPGDEPKTRKKSGQPASYPQGLFRNPLGIPLQLVANFGELRPNHYHMGLDIRTMQRENLPVYAAADGYVRKVKIEKGGFGNALYIEHFNGYTTLYAHLNAFFPELAAYIKQKQYDSKSWEQDLEIDPELFPVKQGQFVALSGNTGASAGPHVHFEIRDTETGNNINPLLFGFGIPDYTPPSVYRLYYYDRRYSTYQSGPQPIAIRKAGNVYSTISDVVQLKTPYISFGISADDQITGMRAHVGIYQAELWVDGVQQTGFTLNDISYDETRYINASVDYRTRMSGGGYIQHVSKLPGNHGSYFFGPSDGSVLLKDSNEHRARIVVKDVAGNTSNIDFRFRWNPRLTNDLVFAANSIPMAPNKINTFETEDFRVMFSPLAFYDTVPFVHRSEPANDPRAVSLLHHIADARIPEHDSFTVQIRPIQNLPDHVKDRVVMQLHSQNRTELEKGTWVNGFVQARFRYLGEAKLLVDTIAPRISTAGWVNGGSVKGKSSIGIVASDNLGKVNRLDAYLDGRWLLFGRTKGLFVHVFDEHTGYGRHELKIIATDEAGNTAERTFSFSR